MKQRLQTWLNHSSQQRLATLIAIITLILLTLAIANYLLNPASEPSQIQQITIEPELDEDSDSLIEQARQQGNETISDQQASPAPSTQRLTQSEEPSQGPEDTPEPKSAVSHITEPTSTSTPNSKPMHTQPVKIPVTSSPSDSIAAGFYIQVGAYRQQSNAQKVRQQLQQAAWPVQIQQRTKGLNVVWIGPWETRNIAKKKQRELKQQKLIDDAFIIEYR